MKENRDAWKGMKENRKSGLWDSMDLTMSHYSAPSLVGDLRLVTVPLWSSASSSVE